MTDDPFTYIAPSDSTRPKHAAITAAEQAARTEVDAVIGAGPWRGERMEHYDAAAAHAAIGAATRALYDAIQAHAPASADRSAAERCARVARMAANAAVQAVDTDERDRFIRLARDHITMAGWQARAAIALGAA